MMLCHLTRRLISRSEDRGKKLPRFSERHIARCADCRDYARFTASLKARLSTEKPALLAAVSEFPLSKAEWATGGTGDKRSEAFGRRLVFHPFPTAAAAVAVVAGAVVLFQVVLREPSSAPEERAAALATLKSITAAPDGFQGIVTEAESSLARERQILERSVLSAFEYLQARLNVRIERKAPAKSL
jgi:hypothetical protein